VSRLKYELGFYIPEDDILHSHRRENLKSYMRKLCFPDFKDDNACNQTKYGIQRCLSNQTRGLSLDVRKCVIRVSEMKYSTRVLRQVRFFKR
jgi:hypothetical protein